MAGRAELRERPVFLRPETPLRPEKTAMGSRFTIAVDVKNNVEGRDY